MTLSDMTDRQRARAIREELQRVEEGQAILGSAIGQLKGLLETAPESFREYVETE